MKKLTLIGTLAIATLGAGGFVAAQTPSAQTDADHAAHHPEKAAPKTGPAQPPVAPGAMGTGSMGGGMMGGDMMGGGMAGNGMMGGGMCPMMMGGANTKVAVKKIDKGVTITLTSSDSATAVRLQKMAEGMRLMHEAVAQ